MAGAGGRVFKPKGFAQDTTISVATTLASMFAGGVIPDGAIRALIQAESQDLRWRDDGTAPTATVGMTLKVNTVLEYDGDLEKIQFIQAAAGGIVNASVYGV